MENWLRQMKKRGWKECCNCKKYKPGHSFDYRGQDNHKECIDCWYIRQDKKKTTWQAAKNSVLFKYGYTTNTNTDILAVAESRRQPRPTTDCWYTVVTAERQNGT